MHPLHDTIFILGIYTIYMAIFDDFKYDSVCTKVGKMAVMVAFGTSVEFKPVYILNIY